MSMSSKTLNEIDREKEKEQVKIIEAILFVSGRFLGMPDLISISDMSSLVILDVLEKLKKKYSGEHTSIEIVERSNMWKMDVKSEYSFIVNKIATGSAEFSKAEQETLAIIAYKQPIKQSVIIKIRGNKAYDHIAKFCDLNLLKKKKEGHTYDLYLSEEFYDYFNVPKGSNPFDSIKLGERD